MNQKITPFLWFETQAEEAATFYVSAFESGKILDVSRYQDDTPGEAGTAMTVSFELYGQQFTALNGGAVQDGAPDFRFTPAISFVIDCETQAEIDRLWDRLCEGGKPVQCGWLEDKFGISWQVVPSILPELLGDENEEKSRAAMQAMLKMTKLEIGPLQDAFNSAN